MGMKLKNGTSIGFDELYERRKQAVALYQQGMKRMEIAPIVGVHRNTVGQWIAIYERGDEQMLRPAKPGRPRGSRRKPVQT